MLELLEQGENFAVATIFDKSGSAPRAEGAKMVVRADGSIIGTNISAETAEELAVSIVGELVKVRSEKTGHKKKDKSGDSSPCCRIQEVPQ
jgi:xanthine dehydrogenase accessory factor